MYATLLHEMGPPGPTKENAQSNKKTDFFFHNLLVILPKKLIKWNAELNTKILTAVLNRQSLKTI